MGSLGLWKVIERACYISRGTGIKVYQLRTIFLRMHKMFRTDPDEAVHFVHSDCSFFWHLWEWMNENELYWPGMFTQTGICYSDRSSTVQQNDWDRTQTTKEQYINRQCTKTQYTMCEVWLCLLFTFFCVIWNKKKKHFLIQLVPK